MFFAASRLPLLEPIPNGEHRVPVAGSGVPLPYLEGVHHDPSSRVVEPRRPRPASGTLAEAVRAMRFGSTPAACERACPECTARGCAAPLRRPAVKTPRTQRSDASDAKAKARFLLEKAAGSQSIAQRIAQAIQADPALLDGNAKVVACLARHEAAAALLHEVFADHAKRYPRTYRAFLDARFHLMRKR